MIKLLKRGRAGQAIAMVVGITVLVAVVAPTASMAAAKTKRVSVKTNGTLANSDSAWSAISANGRFIAFQSEADNLVGNDTNGTNDIFIRDMKMKKTKRLSLNSKGKQAQGHSNGAAISATGRHVAFESDARNLLKGKSNDHDYVYVRDRKTGKTHHVSTNAKGVQGDDDSRTGGISANGRFVVFDSYSSNLVKNDTNGRQDVFVHDRATKRTRRVSVRSNGTEGTGSAWASDISANGRYVVFNSDSPNLVKNDSNTGTDVFIHDRKTKKTKRVNVRTGGGEAIGGSSLHPVVSADGRYVAFESGATNLVNNDVNGTDDVFLRDRKSGKTRRIGADTSGFDGSTRNASISSNGRFVVFAAHRNQGADSGTEIQQYDRKKKKLKVVAPKPFVPALPYALEGPVISADGRFIAFHTESGLVGGDPTGLNKIYRRGPLR